MIALPPTPRQARSRRPVTTLRPGEVVTVHLKGRSAERINAYGGRVLDVDSVAIRIETAWSRFCLAPSLATGERVLPWAVVDRVVVEAPR
ncbi:MAG: hypothetical protein M3Q10_06085 [Chloroflexota bacterium]|nr:hypothetical protein [Chloroflexota bacterium]